MENAGIERRNEIIKMRSEGKTYQEIGKKYGLTKQRVEQIIKREPSDKKLSKSEMEDRKKKILSLFNTGLSRREISRELGISYTTVCYAMKDSNLKMYEKIRTISDEVLVFELINRGYTISKANERS